ncbi:MAG: hypothetical protein CME70_23085 [Halobacteriovorax sp.]|nr:hypothetical protein [Halobacteriovorax sp.]
MFVSMMVMGLTSLTTKSKKLQCGAFLALLLLGTSCSSKKKKAASPALREGTEQYSKARKKEERHVVYGPTSSPTLKGFENKTLEYGLHGETATALYAVDFDNDGFTDLVTLPQHYSVPRFFKFNSKEKKFERLNYNPFPEIVRGSFLSFADFNRDGFLDVLVGTLNQKTELSKYPLRLFKGKKFKAKVRYTEEQTRLPAGIVPNSSVAVFDFDLDGWLDLYQANWYNVRERKPKAVPDRLYKGKTFQFKDYSVLLEGEHEYKKSFKLYPNARPSFGVSPCDINQDGFPDLLIANSSGFENKLWMNRSDRINKTRKFRDFAKVSGVASDIEGDHDPLGGGNSFYLNCADYNNDGIFDLALGELFHSYDPETRDRSSILTGSTFSFPPKFIRTEYHMDDGTGSWSQGDRRATWFDYNRDGLLDLIIDNTGFPPKSRLILFKQESNHAFSDVSEAYAINSLNPSGTIVMDVNRDGRMDFITGQTSIRNSQIKGKIYLYENTHAFDGNRSIRFHLIGQRSNRAAIGSSLVLKTKNFTSKQFVSLQEGGLPSQNESGVFFGLGKNNRLDTLKVRWPLLSKKGFPIEKTYYLSKYKFKEHLELTLCESGKIIPGKVKSCRN